MGADSKISSSASGMSTDDDDTDDDARTVIERRSSVSAETRNGGGDMNVKSPRVPSPSPLASSSDGSKVNGRTSTLNRRTFTRSRSPAPRSLGLNGIMPQPVPPSPTAFFRARSAGPARIVLPGMLSIKIPLWPTPWEYQLRIDAKHAAEGAILMSALACVAQRLQPFSSASPSDDGLPIGAPLLFIFGTRSRADHIHVRASCRHLCLLHLLGLELLFLYAKSPFFHPDRLGNVRSIPESSSSTRTTPTPSWHLNSQQLVHTRESGICMDDRA
jgi:hypothetical protein